METVKNREIEEKINVEKNEEIKTENKKTDKFIKGLKEFFKNNILFFIGTFLLVYKGLLLNYSIGLEIGKDVVIYTVLVSFLLMCPIINNKNKFSYIYFNIIYMIVTLIIFADFIYYSYSTNFLSFYQLVNLQYSKEIASGFQSIISVKSIFTFWIDNVLVIVLSILAYKKFGSTYFKNRIIKTILIIVIIGLNIIVVTTKMNGIYKDKGYNKSLIVQEASIYYYHYEDAKDYLASLLKKEEIDETRLQEIYDKYILENSTKTEYTGIAKDNNVIILQLESLNEYLIGKKVNGKEITPNLNKFFNENIYCSDMYNQGLGTTADSEFEMENSMYPLENGYVFQKYYDNKWQDIYTILREEKGYYTSFMHPNTSTFWNREEVYNVGYEIDEYNDITRFSDIESAGEFYSDEGFFKEAVNIMKNYDGRFCTTLVSVTTHIPFYLDGVSDLENKVTITQEDVKDFDDETYRNYLISCNFVDYAFGEFLKELEEKGLSENSILIVYGDHGSGLTCLNDIEKLYKENGIVYTEFENSTKDVHIPFGIRIPGVDSDETIQKSVAKIDIKPTILDLLGIDDKYSIGKSIFSDKDYSFIKGLGFVTSRYYCINDIYYDRETLNAIDENEELKRILQQMDDEIYLSDSIIKNDLLKNE